MNRRLRFVAILIGLGVFLGNIAAPGQSAATQTAPATNDISISGDIPAPIHLEAKDLDAMPQVKASVVQEDGTTSNYTGVLLRSVLEKAGAPFGRSLRGKAMPSYVLAKARDGYEVMFTLPELDASFGNQRIFLVYKQDGKPLFGYEGPFKILCPDDKAGARSIRMLASLEVVRLRK